MRRRLACLITGVPSGYERCLPTLLHLLDEWQVTYFAIMREEFADEATRRGLLRTLPGVQLIIVPRAETDTAVTQFLATPVRRTLVQMWHEIAVGSHALCDRDEFDLVFRTRFDVFFHAQYLPEIQAANDAEIFIPEQLSWAGSNDMLCLATPQAFVAYAKTFEHLPRIIGEGIFAPEGILSRALAVNGINERRLDVFFLLYREALFSSLSDMQLAVIANIHPALSVYKLGGSGDTSVARGHCIATAEAIADRECDFPLFADPLVGENFYPPETDIRDASTFRWMATYAKIRRALPQTTSCLRLKVHFHITGWEVQHLLILIDGNLVRLEEGGHDKFGRLEIQGHIDRIRPFRRPWSEITFSSRNIVSPREDGSNLEDERMLSVAIGSLQFMEQPISKRHPWMPLINSGMNLLRRGLS